MTTSVDTKLLSDIADAANSAGIRPSHMAVILSLFLTKRAEEAGLLSRSIFRSLSDEVMDAVS